MLISNANANEQYENTVTFLVHHWTIRIKVSRYIVLFLVFWNLYQVMKQPDPFRFLNAALLRNAVQFTNFYHSFLGSFLAYLKETCILSTEYGTVVSIFDK